VRGGSEGTTVVAAVLAATHVTDVC
jgi:hypothetical protein